MANKNEVRDHFLKVIDLFQAQTDPKAAIPKFCTSSSDLEKSLKQEYFEAINFAAQLPKGIRLETFNSFHQNCAAHLIKIFYKIPCAHLENAVKYAKKCVNSSLLTYALSVVLLHRDDAIGINLQIPSHITTEPGMYFDINQIREDLRNNNNTTIDKDDPNRIAVDLNENFTGTDHNPEHKIAYFREDIGLNLHHRHWHEVYPFNADESVVEKDRRGELFYYMHQQIVTRYNFERLCNGLSRAKPYDDFREPIKEAYFPKLNSLSKANQFSSRPENTRWKNLHREKDGFYVKLASMERWRDRIFDAIDSGYAYTIDKNTGKRVHKKIDEETGIDELGNSIEAVEKLSWNYNYYGDLHNKGHLFFSYVHDPDHRFLENGSVMSHSETALRDPIFYRWHVFIDDIFQHYKRTLPPYPLEQRQFKGININSVQIQLQKHGQDCNPQDQNETNVLKTFWEKDSVDVTKGIFNEDLETTEKQILVRFTHLQHEDFEYVIKVNNDLGKATTGTVRIFMAPHQDEAGLPMPFNGQRRMFIEMDKFTHKLEPGMNTIERKSTKSSVTIPFEKSFMTLTNVKEIVENSKLNIELNNANNGYCGCGWPHHLLVGKGTTGEGYLCDLFVMITDYETDKVENSPLNQQCCDKSSLSYCGVRNKMYPDKKPMGFPFDRNILDVKATLEDFMTEEQKRYDENVERKETRPPRLSNMIVVPIRVKHEGGSPRNGKSLQNSENNQKN